MPRRHRWVRQATAAGLIAAAAAVAACTTDGSVAGTPVLQSTAAPTHGGTTTSTSTSTTCGAVQALGYGVQATVTGCLGNGSTGTTAPTPTPSGALSSGGGTATPTPTPVPTPTPTQPPITLIALQVSPATVSIGVPAPPGATALVGSSYQFYAAVEDSTGSWTHGATDSIDVNGKTDPITWTTDEASVATVSAGLVTAEATNSPAATADIIATLANGVSGSAVVTVTNQGNVIVGVN